jgi:dTDP-3-amino-3,4,6-trideoxy-alpha-D-glucopyranose N,N-dimethyltransferase
VYDLLYEAVGKDYAAESSELHDLIQAHRPGARTLLDVACGTGGHLRHLQDHYEVTGVDIDPSMLDEARAHLADEVPLIRADMRTLSLGRTFDAVTCLFSSIGYMRDKVELNAAVSAMARHLGAAGVLVVDGWVRPDCWSDGLPPHVDSALDGEPKVIRMSRSSRRGDVTSLEMHHLLGTVTGIEYLVDHHELTLFPPVEYEGAFAAAGLSCQTLEGPMAGRDRYVGLPQRHVSRHDVAPGERGEEGS